MLNRSKLQRGWGLLRGLALVMLIAGCVPTAPDMVATGHVEPTEYEARLPMQTHHGTALITASAQGIAGRFVLDTGAALTVLDRMPLLGERLAVQSATGDEVAMVAATVETVRVGPVAFRHSYAASGDLSMLAEQIPDFLGLLGQAVLAKANWLIDYERGEVTLRSDSRPPEGMEAVSVHYRGGLPYVVLDIDGITVEALLDSGASTYLTLPRQSSVAQRLQQKYDFVEQVKTRLTIDGAIEQRVSAGTLPVLGVGVVQRRDVPVELRDTERPRLGARFLAAQSRIFLQGGADIWLAAPQR